MKRLANAFALAPNCNGRHLDEGGEVVGNTSGKSLEGREEASAIQEWRKRVEIQKGIQIVEGSRDLGSFDVVVSKTW